MCKYTIFSVLLHYSHCFMTANSIDRNTLLTDALSVLRDGGTLLYPTDTIWGIGCDACCETAVEKLYRIKQRDRSKAMLVLASPAMLSEQLPPSVRELLLNGERPTTVIMPTTWLAQPVAANLPADDGTLGVRVPKHDFCQQLLSGLGHLIVSTSANLSGHPAPQNEADIEAAIRKAVDYCVAPLPELLSAECRGSKIIKVSPQGETFIIRD